MNVETSALRPTLTRDQYGAIQIPYAYQQISHPQPQSPDATAVNRARTLVADAAKAGKIPAAYDRMAWGKKGREKGKRIGEARHHELYDATPDGNRALVCVRDVEGTHRGVSTTGKAYYVVMRHGRGIRVVEANKPVAAKAAKASGAALGYGIAVCLGKAKLRIPASEIQCGYKLVVRTDTAGVYQSAYDGSEWVLGEARIEAATADHSGGFYYYADLDEALLAATRNAVFATDTDHRRLALLRVEASGRHYRHYGNKLCATKVRPVEEVASTL